MAGEWLGDWAGLVAEPGVVVLIVVAMAVLVVRFVFGEAANKARADGDVETGLSYAALGGHAMWEGPAGGRWASAARPALIRTGEAAVKFVHAGRAAPSTNTEPASAVVSTDPDGMVVVKPVDVVSDGSMARIKGEWFPTKIGAIVPVDSVIAVRVTHVLLETEAMCKECMEMVKTGVDLEQMARDISTCELTRGDGGVIGWVAENDEHLDHILPVSARQAAMSRKAGDVLMTQSKRGFHLIRVDDVMSKLNPTVKRGHRTLAGSGERLPSVTEQLSGGINVVPTYTMETMGCQMNVADSERIAGQLEDMGLREATDAEKQNANVVILNTCSIRDHAEQKVYSAIGPHAIRKRQGKPVAIVVAGCVAQQEGAKLMRRVPEVDLVMGPQYANRISDLLEDVLNGNQVVATDPLHIMEDMTKPRRGSTVCAWVNIIYGCNEHCTYCVVPGTRGVEQSRPKEAIVAEAEGLVQAGYREITLLGQNIDAWGRDMQPKQRFADLLRHVSAVEGLERVRFVTSHPRYMSPRVIKAVADCPNLMETFHIPFQSGNNQVLRNMRRGYTREKYLGIVSNIRNTFGEDVSITGDVIVGFPGETEEQFLDTLRLMEEVKFDACMCAAYSPRPNTEAAVWDNQVPDDVKQDRLQKVQRMQTQTAAERSSRYLGMTVEVLVEVRNTKNPRQVMGRTRTNRQVFFDGDIEQLRGKLVHVLVTETRPFTLTGTLIEDVPPR